MELRSFPAGFVRGAATARAGAVLRAVRPLGPGTFLLEVTPRRLTIASSTGAAGAVLVELSHRSIVLLGRLATTDPKPRPEALGP